jgi:Ser/Thr protein kinase RdoA (MazF antagonist)
MSSSLSARTIQDALRRFFADPVVTDTTFFKMGAENITVRLEGNFGSLVLRVWGEQHSRMGTRKLSDIQGELAFMDACRSSHLPVPRIHVSLAGHEFEELADKRKFSVMDYVEGDEPANFNRPMIENLATAVAKMNVLGQTFTFPSPRSWRGTIIDLARERVAAYRAKGMHDEFVEYVANRLEQQLLQTNLNDLPFGPIHGDIMYQNIKYVDERLSGIFDFDDCRESYLVEDITKTLYFAIEDPAHCVLGDTIANARIFMHAYEQVRPLSEQEKAALPVLSTARYLYELLKYHLHGAKNPQAPKILEAKRAAYQKFRMLFEERLTR